MYERVTPFDGRGEQEEEVKAQDGPGDGKEEEGEAKGGTSEGREEEAVIFSPCVSPDS